MKLSNFILGIAFSLHAFTNNVDGQIYNCSERCLLCCDSSSIIVIVNIVLLTTCGTVQSMNGVCASWNPLTKTLMKSTMTFGVNSVGKFQNFICKTLYDLILTPPPLKVWGEREATGSVLPHNSQVYPCISILRKFIHFEKVNIKRERQNEIKLSAHSSSD
ncbi:hypothetical protein Anas_12228 [Armadillidium nasatum]|uniref:Uncharacterized protein n=1 Tax=Armadillidium nasatum TaxID=96803 RepID=A0A5N5SNW7_9CRUS|nr:hypothetical protein Anas_12228 [Armadillidium nasatum]